MIYKKYQNPGHNRFNAFINRYAALVFAGMLSLFSSCAVLHHVQVGEIDNRKTGNATSFDIKVSETGFNLKEAGDVSRRVLHPKDSEKSDELIQFIQMFQMGPHTGNGVLSYSYADHLEQKIREKCPSGKVTGLLMIRETRKYPVISGEIVKIKGFCLGG